MRDYQKDLEICEKYLSPPKVRFAGLCTYEELKIAMVKSSSEFMDLAREALPHYIIRCVELDSKISFQHQHVNAVRQKYNLSPDIGFEDLAKLFANAKAEGAVMREALEHIDNIMHLENDCNGVCNVCVHCSLSDAVREAMKLLGGDTSCTTPQD